MPNRMLRDWTDSDKVNILSSNAERLFVRLIMKADDYGCFHADTRLVKASLFPLLLDGVREADISRWMAECQKAGLIVLYEANSKKYLQIVDFKQRLDKARAKFPFPPGKNNFPELVNEFRPEVEVETELEKEKEKEKEKHVERPPNGVAAEAIASASDNQLLYKSLKKDKIAISDFIKKTNPQFIEPYFDLWNLFAYEKSMPKISKITDSRKRKFNVRIKEKGFDFLKIFKKASQSEFILTGNWFGFDWIFENEKNWIKVIEGNYDKKDTGYKPKVENDLQYLIDLAKEGHLDTRLIETKHFEELKKSGLVKIDQSVITKRIASLEGSVIYSSTQLMEEYQKGIKSKLIEADMPALMKLAVMEYLKTLKKYPEKRLTG